VFNFGALDFRKGHYIALALDGICCIAEAETYVE
jgi:hypothetical protein